MSGRVVWMVNHYASTPEHSAGTRHFSLAKELLARGHAVTIFAAGVSHKSGLEAHLGRSQLFRAEWVQGVRFVWLRTVPYRGNTWRRQVNMLSFLAAFLVVQSREPRPDLVIGSTVHPFAALGGWLAAKLRGARFAFEIRDLWPQTLVDLGALRQGSPGERLLRFLEAFLVRRATAVITLLPGVRAYLEEQGLPADHVVYIPNGVDPEAFGDTAPGGPLPASAEAVLAEIARLRGEGRFVLGYLGAFGRVNRVDLVAEAAKIAEERQPGRVGVVLVGSGPERPAVERQAADSPAVTVGPAVPRTAVPAILAALDATIVHATYTPVYRYGISFNKLFEYMAAARPVVFACDSAYDPVAATGAGLTVAPDDPAGLAEALLAMARATPEALAAMGAAGRAYVAREHDFAALGEQLLGVVEGGPPARGRA